MGLFFQVAEARFIGEGKKKRLETTTQVEIEKDDTMFHAPQTGRHAGRESGEIKPGSLNPV